MPEKCRVLTLLWKILKYIRYDKFHSFIPKYCIKNLNPGSELTHLSFYGRSPAAENINCYLFTIYKYSYVSQRRNLLFVLNCFHVHPTKTPKRTLKSKGFSCIGSVFGNMRSVQTICENTLTYIQHAHAVWSFRVPHATCVSYKFWSLWVGWFVASKPPTRTRILHLPHVPIHEQNETSVERNPLHLGIIISFANAHGGWLSNKFLCVYFGTYTEFREEYTIVALYVYVYTQFLANTRRSKIRFVLLKRKCGVGGICEECV